MNKAHDECCAKCAYWFEWEFHEDSKQWSGFCQRFPPAATEGSIGDFPETYDINWCGEFKPDIGMEASSNDQSD